MLKTPTLEKICAVSYNIPMLGKTEKMKEIYTLSGLLLCMFFGYMLIHDLLGGTLLAHNWYDSYTLQAMAWRTGSLAVPECSWLELATYNGQFYVSFPPFPSVVMLPLTYIFGENTPSNLVVALTTMASAALVYKLARGEGRGLCRRDSVLTALIITWGSNMMWMSTLGGVWFIAQCMCMLLQLIAIYCAWKNRRVAAYLMMALAVGCRPFSAVGFVPLFIYFYVRDKKSAPERGFVRTALKQLPALILPLLVAAAYMWYNYARFNDPLEFGHNYLPEFIASPEGQFNLSYIAQNLLNILRPITLGDGLTLKYEVFDGFLFFVANPFFIWFFISAARVIKAREKLGAVRIALVAALFLELLLLCAHKTFGGWQFGARYMVDLLPLALAFVLLSFRRDENGAAAPLRAYERAIAYFGVMLNVYGALSMTFING